MTEVSIEFGLASHPNLAIEFNGVWQRSRSHYPTCLYFPPDLVPDQRPDRWGCFVHVRRCTGPRDAPDPSLCHTWQLGWIWQLEDPTVSLGACWPGCV